MTGEQIRVCVEIDTGSIANVVSAFLKKADHVVIAIKEAAGATPCRVWAVEGDLDRGNAIERVELVETCAAPVIVRLIGRDRHLVEDVRRRLVGADNESNVADRTIRRDQLGK